MRRILVLTLLVLTACTTQPASVATESILEQPTSAATESVKIASESIPDFLANLSNPNCDSGPTPADQEGPYYKANTPERTSLLETGMEGKKLVLIGFVTNSDCFPIPRVMLDFWQADAQGVYDNETYTLRGHQFTDNKGRYYLETILPGKYPERPIEHIHVKLQAPKGELFTTQLYFSTQPVDGQTISLEDKGDYYLGVFNFALP